MASIYTDYLVSDDIYVHYTPTSTSMVKNMQEKKAPDVFIATPIMPDPERKSFIKEHELEMLADRQGELRMIAIEVMSDSNYADKTDQPKRFFFYDGLGVEEYIVIHTQPDLSLEVFWRIEGHLQRILFYQNYKIQMLNVSFEIETIPAEGANPAIQKLHLVASDGTRFGNYTSEREIRKQTQKTLQTIEVVLKETEEERKAEQEARIEAQKAQKEAKKAQKEAEKRAEAEKEERIAAEESARKALFELEELRNLLKVQKNY